MSSTIIVNFIQTVESKSSAPHGHVSFEAVFCNPSALKIVQSEFKKVIEPIYGDQKNALAKIKEGRDRTCEIMFKSGIPIGLIVYKNILQEEYGFKNALELKTLFLFNPNRNSGRGLGSMLFSRIDEVAKDMEAALTYCTASSKVENSLNCALKNGYKIDRIIEENDKHILYLLIKGR
jgi:hypothetical protein